jgi:tetratricopeptide (TPR) repeat protein
MTNRLFLAGILAISCASVLQAQGTPAQANAGGAEGSSDIGKQANFGKLMDKQTGSMHFYGKVAMAGGRLPWDPVPVVVICNGVTKYSTFASTKGDFDIAAANRESEVLTEKNDLKHVSPSQLVGCTVKALADGFDSNTLTIANRSLEDDPSIGTITLRSDEKSKGSIVSPTTDSAPPDARKEFEKARADDMNRKTESARRHLEKAVSIDPKFAEAWYQLGRLEETDKPQDALTALQKAAAADPAFISPYQEIAALSANEKKWNDVVAATSKSLQLDPIGTPQIWYFNAVGNLNLGAKDIAETSADKALAMDPSHVAPNTEQLLAVILAGRGDYSEALKHLRHCLTYIAPGPNADLVKQQVAQLEKVVPQGAQ